MKPQIMNKNLELAKILGLLSITAGILFSAVHLSTAAIKIGSFQFMDGREQLADLAFKNSLFELGLSFVFLFLAVSLLTLTIIFSVKGYREKK